MKFIISTVKNFFLKKTHKPLGRWNIEKCNIKIDNKVDLSMW
jgi:hypothetical protein